MSLLPRLTKPQKAPHSSQFSEAPLKRTKNGVTITLPPDLLESLGIDNEVSSIYYALTNGVAQLSARQPALTIPVAAMAEGDFVKASGGD